MNDSHGRQGRKGTLPSLIGRMVSHRQKPPGTVPGTLVHTGVRKAESVLIRLIEYSPDSIDEGQYEDIEACLDIAQAQTMSWVNIDGLHEEGVIESVGTRFGIHRLVLEDILSTSQRSKAEDYGGHLFVILKMLSFDQDTDSIISEQVSLVIGEAFVFSFQEQRGDVFEPVRERLRQGKGRIRSRGSDYLAYALIDTVVDSYFHILEAVGDRIEELEEQVLATPTVELLEKIHHLRREMLILRRAVWPLRETLGQLYREDMPLITSETEVFLRDVHDHAVQVIDTVESLREVLSGAMDMYMSGVSNRMNEVMKVLTIIATIFIPLSFFAGLYGMNFQYMPELGLRWAYPALLIFMGVTAGGMLWAFRRKGWL
jgi:magnesium transporter